MPSSNWGGVLCRPEQRFRIRSARNRGVNDPGSRRETRPNACLASFTPRFPVTLCSSEVQAASQRDRERVRSALPRHGARDFDRSKTEA